MSASGVAARVAGVATVATVNPAPGGLDHAALGERLRAFRIGAALQAEEVAARLGVSRAAVYRMEKGEIVKIETLGRLATLFGTTLASLLGAEVEYYPTALGFFERMRQLEAGSERVVAHFGPVSLLLTSDAYLGYLRAMLSEATPRPAAGAEHDAREALLAILQARKQAFATRAPAITSLIGLRELERLLQVGLVGRLDVGAKIRRDRLAAARAEVLRIAHWMEHAPAHSRLGLVDDAMPPSNFQLFYGAGAPRLAVSPFRLGELPNVRNGVATVTAAPEAVALYEAMAARLWASAYRGAAGAERIRALVARGARAREAAP